ncbi:MAG: PAS domain-containing protein [Cognaticolwellia sp.]
MSDKNKTVKALQQQLQVMSNVLDNIGSFVYSKDLNGKYTYANADVAKLFNTPVQEIIGKDDSQFFDLNVSNELRENDQKVIDSKTPLITEERNMVKSTGKVHTYTIIKQPIFNNNGEVTGLSGISIDITEQKELEAKNREQKQLLDVILDNVDAYIYMKDLTWSTQFKHPS